MDPASLDEKISDVQSQIKVKKDELVLLTQLLQKYQNDLDVSLKEKPSSDVTDGSMSSSNLIASSAVTLDSKFGKGNLSNSNLNNDCKSKDNKSVKKKVTLNDIVSYDNVKNDLNQTDITKSITSLNNIIDSYVSSSMYNFWMVVFASLFIQYGYLITVSPSIAGGDSGEVVAEGCILGTAHPPGYPLFTIITFLVTKYIYFTNYSPALRINITSTLFTTLAAVFIGFTIKNIYIKNHGKEAISVTGGIIFAMGTFSFSPLIWQYAVTAEVFPLNTFFASLIVYLVVRFSIEKKLKIAIFGAFVCGLALCNQHTIILYEAPLIAWMLYIMREQIILDYTILFYLSFAFILGLMPYIYLPITATYNPTLGSWGNLDSFDGFLHHFLRKDYGTFQLFSGAAGKNTEKLWDRNAAYINDLNTTQGPPYIIVSTMIVGALSLIRKLFLGIKVGASEKKMAIYNNVLKKSEVVVNVLINEVSYESIMTPVFLIGTQVFYFLVFHSLANLPLSDKLLYGVHQRFWMQPAIITFILVGVGYIEIWNIITYYITWSINVFSKSNNSSSKKNLRKLDSNVKVDTNNNLLFHSVFMVCVFLAIKLVLMQYSQYFTVSDQSQSYYFHRYARALLDPIPNNSIVLINYDMQWTAIRYLQQCEGYRPDVTAINLSMMTYKWFQHKRKLYPTNVQFPGTYYSRPSLTQQKDNAFTLLDFLSANIDQNPIFLGGKVSFPEPDVDNLYDLIPFGLLKRFVPKQSIPNDDSKHDSSLYAHYSNATLFRVDNSYNWHIATRALPSLPDTKKYTEETWEWTIGRDFKDSIADTGAFLLDNAIKIANVDPLPLVEAIYFLESCIYLERGVANISAHSKISPYSSVNDQNAKISALLFKNAGLGHVHLVQNKLLNDHDSDLYEPINDLFQTVDAIKWPINGSIKKWSSDRFLVLWGSFLSHPDAKQDHQYETIKNIYEKAVSATATSGASAATQKPRSKKSKKKS